jgi:hypothetical protein
MKSWDFRCVEHYLIQVSTPLTLLHRTTVQRPFLSLNFSLRKFKRLSNVFQGGAVEYKAES